MMYPKKPLAQLIISACHDVNIETVVISPGSRNAPLTIGFSNSETIECISIVDERCAAFFALGMAQQQQKPVAILCTSGSALLNYYPAIAEAFYSQIPLVVISADRPKHLIDIGDGQTIRQENVFENHVVYAANLRDGNLDYNIKELSTALRLSAEKKGPVHINVPFDEPLYETTDKLGVFSMPATIEPPKNESTMNFEVFSKIWNGSKKILILIGVNAPSSELQNVLNHLVKDSSVLIMTETTSNLHHDNFITAIDQLISKFTEHEFKALQPELLITLGGMVISKRIKQFLRVYQPKKHWHIDEHRELNTFFCLSDHIKMTPASFFENLKILSKESSYQSIWLAEKVVRNAKQHEFLKHAQYSDFVVFDKVMAVIPENSQLQISNSSMIRYAQLFNLNKTTTVFCNRGTSGIDGSTSTAIGAAFASNRQTIFITGDISFFYDSNALWNAHIPENFRIILINNSGGGIFKIIPGPKSTNALPYFETPHNLTAKHLAAMFHFEYIEANNMNEVTSGLSGFFERSLKPKILEIFTPPEINDVVLQEYFKSL